MEVQPTDRPSPGHSNEPKAIAHIRVASGIRTRVRRIEFIPSGATGLPPLVLISLARHMNLCVFDCRASGRVTPYNAPFIFGTVIFDLMSGKHIPPSRVSPLIVYDILGMGVWLRFGFFNFRYYAHKSHSGFTSLWIGSLLHSGNIKMAGLEILRIIDNLARILIKYIFNNFESRKLSLKI